MEAYIATIDVTPLSTVERSELSECETVIESGERVFVIVGNALLTIRDKRLYRDVRKTFEEYLADRWPNISRRRAYQLMDAANVAENVKNFSQIAPNESQAAKLASIHPEDQPIAWLRAVDTAPNGKVTAAHVEQVVSEMHPRAVAQMFPYTCDTCGDRFGQPVWHCPGCEAHYHMEDEECSDCHGYTRDGKRTAYADPVNDTLDPPMELEQVADQFPDELTATDRELLQDDAPELDSNEWYTPVEFIEAARAVMGSIDTDPASNDMAQTFIQARDYYTKETNGLAQSWGANVWLNPPYADPLPWVEKLLSEFEAGNTKQAILLVNTANSPQWSRLLWQSNFSVCLLSRRVRFWRPDRTEAKGTAQDQMIWYIGYETDSFRREFESFGAIR